MLRGRSRRQRFGAVTVVVVGIACILACVAFAASATPLWPSATEVTPPAGSTGTAGNAQIAGVACAAVGDCTAVGAYLYPTSSLGAMAATEQNGVWGQATAVTAPDNAAMSGTLSAQLTSVACPGAGICVAVGGYRDTNGTSDYQAMVATESAGVWSQAAMLTLPVNATTTSNGQFAELNAVTCTGTGDCTAGGYYKVGGQIEPMVATETNGVWAQATEIALPAGGDASQSGDASTGFYGVSCTSVGTCVATGTYADSSGDDLEMVATETGSVWGQAAELTLPVGATTSPGAQQSLALGVACSSLGNCSTVGFYVDQDLNQQAMAATETNGVWDQGTELAPPANVSPSGGAQLNSVACTSAGNCVADGSYPDADQPGQGLLATETGGVWGQGTELTLPTNAATGPGDQYATLNALACPAPGQCVGGGTYNGPSGFELAMVVSSVAPLSVSSSSLPAGTVGLPYSAQLSATGGAGDYKWSVSAGALPPGLTLNAATGTISGTPTGAGTASFTVTAADPGPPAQTASAPLSILVSPAPPVAPNTGLGKSTISSAKHTAKFTFRAVGEATRFQCALVKAPTRKHAKTPKPKYAACTSPKTYKHLAAGHYTFYTRAIGPGGTDPTPATRRFKIT